MAAFNNEQRPCFSKRKKIINICIRCKTCDSVIDKRVKDRGLYEVQPSRQGNSGPKVYLLLESCYLTRPKAWVVQGCFTHISNSPLMRKQRESQGSKQLRLKKISLLLLYV